MLFQQRTKGICGMGNSWIQDHQTILQNKEGKDYNGRHLALRIHQ